MRTLGLKSGSQWKEYCKSGNKPDEIPAFPSGAYAGKGWVSMGDWLGTGTVQTQARIYRSFEEAREFVRGLNLDGQKGWSEYVKSGTKPDDIPAAPWQVYANAGWVKLGDWLGTDKL